MCVIAYKPKNIDLMDDKIIANMWAINSDGAGYMFVKNDNVIIKKGYLKLNDFLKDLKEDYNREKLKEKNLILHFRIGTSGGITKEKTHPFPLSNNDKLLDALRITNKNNYGIVHNGVLSDYTYNQSLSDTQSFIKDFLFELNNLKPIYKNNALINRFITNELKGSKLVILDKKDNVYMYGDFKQDNGIYYSNATYKTSYYTSELEPTTYNFKNYNYNYASSYNDNYDYYDEDFYSSLYQTIASNRLSVYKLVPNDCIISVGGYELYNYNESEFTYYVDSALNCYELDHYNFIADYIGHATIYDDNNRVVKYEDL